MKRTLALVCLCSLSLELMGMSKAATNVALETLDESALLALSSKGNRMADYYLAGLYNDKNETAKAQEFFKRAAPVVPEAYYMLGVLANEAANSAEAERMYAQAAEKRVCEAEYEMGNIFLKRQDLTKAREFYERAGAQGHVDGLHNAATLCEEQGDYANAAAHYTAAKKQYAQLAQEGNRVAESLYEQVIEQEKLEKEARSREGIHLHAAGCFFLNRAYWGPQPHRARYYLTLAVGKKYIPSYRYLGEIFEKEGLLDKAQECYTIAAEGDDCEAQYLLGKLIEKHDAPKAKALFTTAALKGQREAQQKLTRTLKIARNAHGLRDLYFQTDSSLQEWRVKLLEALKSLATADHPTDTLSREAADIQYCLAQLYENESRLEQERLTEANLKVAYYQKRDLQEKSTSSHSRASSSVGFAKRIEFMMAEVETSKKKLRELQDLTKKQYFIAHKVHVEAAYQLFLIYLSEGNVDEAKALYATGADSGDAYALTRMGDVAFIQGDQDLAQQVWESAAKKGQKEACYALGKHYTRLAHKAFQSDTDRDNALTCLQKAKALYQEAAEYADAAYELGKIYCNEGNVGQAIVQLEHAASHGHIKAHGKLGIISKTKGDKAAALHHFGYAGARGDKWALYHLGRLAQQRGTSESALRYYRRAILAGNDCAAHLLYEQFKGDTEKIGFISEMRFETPNTLAEIIEDGDGEAVRLYIKRFTIEQSDLAWLDSLNDSFHDADKSLRDALLKRDSITGDISLHRAVRAFNLSSAQALVAPDLLSLVQGPGKPYCSVKNLHGKSFSELAQDFSYSDFVKVIRDTQQKRK